MNPRLVLFSIGLGLLGACAGEPPPPPEPPPAPEPEPEPEPPPPPPPHRFVDRDTVGTNWSFETKGLLQFRGNPTHTFYGTGPVPKEAPKRLWRFPDEKMCHTSSTGTGIPKEWCGTGWTGQPIVWERPDGITEVMFGAFDTKFHFLDAATGKRLRPDFEARDLFKGSASLDPNGYPLLYAGATDAQFRIIALDREEPTVLWQHDARPYKTRMNDDWDSNPSIVDDYLFTGAERGYLFAWKLNRGYDADGRVTVDPEMKLQLQGWTEEIQKKIFNNSIENSVAIWEGHLFFGTSGGRIVGVNIEDIDNGNAPIIFDFWMGDDVDASIVIDEEGFLYVAAELEAYHQRAKDVGQLVKLDWRKQDDPIVWGIPVSERGEGQKESGIWSTPALGDGVLYVSTHNGKLLAVDTETGEIVWEDPDIGLHAWSSPVLVDDTLVQSVACFDGGSLQAYDVSDPRAPKKTWLMKHLQGCFESTPAIWNGTIYVGSRDGYFYAFGEKPKPKPPTPAADQPASETKPASATPQPGETQ